jgi:hypothetical protein
MTDEKNPYRADQNKEDQLTWFQLMWMNSYIQLFGVAIVFLVAEIYFWDTFFSLGGLIVGLAIPIGMMILIAYKGFYQFWNDYKNGKSR